MLKKMVASDQAEMLWYADDCADMVRIAAERGYELHPFDAQCAWSEHSEADCASWLFLGACCEGPDRDEGIWQAILPYLREAAS